MQNLKFPLTALLAIIFISFSSCNLDDDEDDKEDYEVTVGNVVGILTENDWEVYSFVDGDEGEEAAKFAGYRFTFNSTYQVTATKNGDTASGLWGCSQKGDLVILSINFYNEPFKDLDEPWAVYSMNATRIYAKDEDGDGDTEELILAKWSK